MKTYLARTPDQWRKWLVTHHDSESEVWLVFYKAHTGRRSIAYSDAIDEALCFGWVDSLVKRLDDARYALMFVHDKRELEGWGTERIRRGLAERGIDRELIETALHRHDSEWVPEQTELDRALALLRRRFPTPPRERRERDRALGALIRKGFESELALDALSAYSRGD